MTCPGCNTENPPEGRFCKSCGSPLGVVCSSCGRMCELEDAYCGVCGTELTISVGSDFPDDPGTGSPSAAAATIKQYTPREIEELLILRKVTKKENPASKVLRQSDVDQLFG